MIEAAAMDVTVRVVNVRDADAEPLCRVLSEMHPPEGFHETDFQRLCAAVCGASTPHA